MTPTLHRRRFLRTTAAMIAGGYACQIRGQDAAQRHPASVEAFLEQLYAADRRQRSFRPDYPGGFHEWQRDARPLLRRLIGLDTIAKQVSGYASTVQLGDTRERDAYTLTAGTLHSEPHVEVPFWLLRPPGDGPFPLAILPHGHNRRGHDIYAGEFDDDQQRQEALAEDRDVAVQAAKRGFLAIAPAVRGLASAASGVPDVFRRHGERDCRSQLMHAILIGRTAIGERVWDMSRLLDWATRLPEVDARQILMMGNSGGGVVTMYAAATDSRITVAVPSCSFSVIASRAGRIFHCDCCAVLGILQQMELFDVCGLIAPRHLLAVNGRTDQLHTEEDVERSAARVRRIYAAAGVPSRFAHHWGAQGHRFYGDLMWPFVEEAMQA